MNTNFATRIRVALSDPSLRANFRGAMDFLQAKRRTAFSNEDEWTALQRQGKAIRQQTLHQLPELLEQLEHNCLQNGINVHWAEDAEEARQIFLTIAQEENAKKVVKGKSMATEEIGLNAFLEEHEIECIESDMGEYIVQLAEETPSHIIMPAIHKNQAQIAELFQDKLHEECDANNVDQLIGIGRKVLRQKFKHADIGVSGVNFAIADSGTLCLVENEGNGRLSTTAPQTHIALMGIEKVIPNLSCLPTLQSLLTRSATGQHITTYLNLITSPRKQDEHDGPLKVHLILLDNGRSRIAQDEALHTTLACIRCGACMNHCPVYTRIGGHAYGSTYPGPIGQILTPQLNGMDEAGELLDACSLNGACGEACPVGIELPELMRELRQRKHHSKHTTYTEHIIWRVWKRINRHPKLYYAATRTLSRLGLSRTIFPKAWRQTRHTPMPAKQSLHQQLKARKQRP